MEGKNFTKFFLPIYHNIYSEFSMWSIFQDSMMQLIIGKHLSQIHFSQCSQPIY